MPQTRRRRAALAERSLLLDLPEAILQHILSFVPAKSLGILSCVARLFKEEDVPNAIPLRAERLGRGLEVRHGDESMLKALHFVEVLSSLAPATISADTCHTVCIGSDQVVRAWGGHEGGPDDDDDDAFIPGPGEQLPCWLSHLGIDQETGYCVPVPTPMVGLPSAVRIVEVAAGYEHTLLRCASGGVFSCGVGDHGRLGHGFPLETHSTPRRIDALAALGAMAQISAGGFQSLALSMLGHVYTWGWGESGSTGHGMRGHQYTPKQVEALREVRIVQASAGSGHTLCVSVSGDLYACGDHRYGKLGLGKLTEDALSPRRVVFKERGVRVRQASAWHAHSLVVTTEGKVYSFGCGERGRLGHGDERPRYRPNPIKRLWEQGAVAKSVAAGELHSCVLTESGRVYTFGDCIFGQTGVQTLHPMLLPSLCLPDPLPNAGAMGGDMRVAELAVGDHHTIVRRDNGALYAFGKNDESQLGLGVEYTNRRVVAQPRRVVESAVASQEEGAVPSAADPPSPPMVLLS